MLKPYAVLVGGVLLFSAQSMAQQTPVSPSAPERTPSVRTAPAAPTVSPTPENASPQTRPAPQARTRPRRRPPNRQTQIQFDPQKYVGLGMAFASHTTRSDDILYNEIFFEASTRNDFGRFFGLYSDTSLGGAFNNELAAFLGLENASALGRNFHNIGGVNTQFALLLNTGSAFHFETRLGMNYIFGIGPLEMRWSFGASLGIIEGYEDLSWQVIYPYQATARSKASGRLLIIGPHLGWGLEYRTPDKDLILGTSLFFDLGYHESSYSGEIEGDAVADPILSSRVQGRYVGGEFSFYARHRLYDQTYLQFEYDLDMENTVLPDSQRRHKIGLSVLWYR